MSLQTWPFLPTSQLVEVLEWQTDIIKTQTREQRICTRAAPRRTFSIASVVRWPQAELARDIVRRATAWQAPDWPQMVSLGAATTGSPCALPDGPVMIITGHAAYSLSTVAGGVLGVVSPAVGPCRVVPLVQARLTGAMEISKRPGGFASLTAEFELIDGQILQDAAGYYPEYAGLPFVNDCNRTSSGGAATEGVLWPENVIDNSFGRPAVIRTRQYANVAFSQRWQEFDRDRIAALRGWIGSRRGCWKPFWLPGSGELHVRQTLAATIEVEHHTPYEHHLVLTIDGARVPFEIRSASDTGRGWSLTLDRAIPSGTISSAAYLRRVRFDADRIEIEYKAGAGASVEIPCLEVVG